MKKVSVFILVVLTAAALSACAKRPPSGTAAAPAPEPIPGSGTGSRTQAFQPTKPAEVPPAPPIIPPEPTITSSDPLASAAIEEINRNSPLKAVFFHYDSDALDDAARKTIADNAEVLKRYSSWVITIEGHCDERGTSEYNLALGDRRALAARNYLITLGVSPDRVRTVSYGNEFPFDPGHDEGAWIQNRRAHFMLTSKTK